MAIISASEETSSRGTGQAIIGTTTTDVNAQVMSPLFTLLPLEIRSMIFSLLVAAVPDPATPYPPNSFWYFPGYTAPRRTSVSILTVCQRMYQEASPLIWMKGNGNEEETFWWGIQERRPLEYRCEDPFDDFEYKPGDPLSEDENEEDDERFRTGTQSDGDYDEIRDNISETESDRGFQSQEEESVPEWFDKYSAATPHILGGREDSTLTKVERQQTEVYNLIHTDLCQPHIDGPLQSFRQKAFTPSQWSKIQRIRIFAAPERYLFNSQHFLRTFIQASGLRPRSVKITIRWADWRGLFSKLHGIAPDPMVYYLPESVQRLTLEVEAAENERIKLDHEIQCVLEQKEKWRWRRLDDVYLEMNCEAEPNGWEWNGMTPVAEGSDEESDWDEGEPAPMTRKYIVKVLTFNGPICPAEYWEDSTFRKSLSKKDYATVMRSAGKKI